MVPRGRSSRAPTSDPGTTNWSMSRLSLGSSWRAATPELAQHRSRSRGVPREERSCRRQRCRCRGPASRAVGDLALASSRNLDDRTSARCQFGLGPAGHRGCLGSPVGRYLPSGCRHGACLDHAMEPSERLDAPVSGPILRVAPLPDVGVLGVASISDCGIDGCDVCGQPWVGSHTGRRWVQRDPPAVSGRASGPICVSGVASRSARNAFHRADPRPCRGCPCGSNSCRGDTLARVLQHHPSHGTRCQVYPG